MRSGIGRQSRSGERGQTSADGACGSAQCWQKLERVPGPSRNPKQPDFQVQNHRMLALEGNKQGDAEYEERGDFRLPDASCGPGTMLGTLHAHLSHLTALRDGHCHHRTEGGGLRLWDLSPGGGVQRGRGCALAESSLWASLPGSFIPPNPGGVDPWPRSYTLGNGDTVGGGYTYLGQWC